MRRSNRERKVPDRYGNGETHYIYINYVCATSPQTYDEALSSSESSLWKEAMQREIDCINKNKTWKLVDRPKDKKIIDLKWVFTNKANNNKKARLVVRGFQQNEVLEDIYSPVARLETLKLLLAFCVQHKYLIEQMDVETAFLNGLIKSEVYVKQPNGYDDKSGKVYKLLKSLYGLRESPRAWYECFDKFIVGLGFERSENDYCLYILDNGSDDKIFLILFVDDLLICGKNAEKSTIQIAKFGNLTKRSKYIEIHYHFVNECFERKEIDIIKEIQKKI